MPTTKPEEEWRQHVVTELKAQDKRLDEGQLTMLRLSEDMANVRLQLAQQANLMTQNTTTTNNTAADVTEMLQVFKSWKGAFFVIEWLGKLAVPVLAIGSLVAAVWTGIKAAKGG